MVPINFNKLQFQSSKESCTFLLAHGYENKSSDFLMFYFNSLARSDLILMSDSFGSLEDTKKRPKISGDAHNPFLY